MLSLLSLGKSSFSMILFLYPTILQAKYLHSLGPMIYTSFVKHFYPSVCHPTIKKQNRSEEKLTTKLIF